jgi:hypothetical protein
MHTSRSLRLGHTLVAIAVSAAAVLAACNETPGSGGPTATQIRITLTVTSGGRVTSQETTRDASGNPAAPLVCSALETEASHTCQGTFDLSQGPIILEATPAFTSYTFRTWSTDAGGAQVNPGSTPDNPKLYVLTADATGVPLKGPVERAVTATFGKGAIVGDPDGGDGGPIVDIPPDAGPPSGPTLSLAGNWQVSMDANQNNPAPTMTLLGSSASTVTVAYNGGNGSQCDCNAEHLVIPLGKTMTCASSTLEFDYSTAGKFGSTSTSSVSVRFCTGTCPTGGFYGGPQFVGSEQSGHSNCAIPFGNTFPAAQLHEGRNTIPLGSLSSALNGSCGGSFDTIDVHMQGYGCFAGQDMATSTLSNLRVY